VPSAERVCAVREQREADDDGHDDKASGEPAKGRVVHGAGWRDADTLRPAIT